MAFTNLTLSTTPLLETTFISDMRLIVNANVAVVKGKVEDLINTFEFELTNKYIGVDNYFNQVKTNNVILGNSISFMDTTNVIGSLTKSVGKSILSVDKLVIQAGGSIDMTGTGNTMAVKKFGVGMSLANLQNVALFADDAFYVGSPATSTPIKSQFYGETKFLGQAVTQSTDTPTVPNLITLSAESTYYHSTLVLSKTSNQFIYLSIQAADSSPSGKPVYLFLMEDALNRPNPGQSFTIVIKEYLDNSGLSALPVADWGHIKIAPGYIDGTNTQALINGGTHSTAATSANAVVFALANQHVELYNTAIQADITTKPLIFGSSVTFTKFENLPSIGAVTDCRFVITGSHNINIIN
jgi:hypothetical protein